MSHPEQPARLPYQVEIRIDGRTAHRFLASEFKSEETRNELTLRAERWWPGPALVIENPLVPVGTMSQPINVSIEGTRSWCCGTQITQPHVPGCIYEPRPDNPIDYAGPVIVKPTPEDNQK